ncbi:MAG: ROK family transcriptional regulator [Spirochaetales bacterium]|nr:ROK family transcriptional regulator [Spirochaetales bacterium]
MAIVKRNRIINASKVIRDIWIHKRISRIQISKNLNLDKSTVSSIITDLIAIGLVKEVEEGKSGPQGGRKPVILTLNKKYGCVIGIELRPESYNALAVDIEGNIFYSKHELASISGKNLSNVFINIIARIRSEIDVFAIPILGMGIGLSGVVNPLKGIIKYSIPLRIENPYNFYSEIAKNYDIPIFLENDANACAWGELAFHRTSNLKDFIFLLVEFRDVKDKKRIHEKTAVGIGLVINGKIHYGYNFSAGEFRSVMCGENFLGQFSLSPDEAFRIEEDPDVLHKFMKELSSNMAMLINTFNLGDVFLGGDIENWKDDIYAILKEEIGKNWSYSDEVNCSIHFSSLKEKAVAYGAAGMVLNHLFTDDNDVVLADFMESRPFNYHSLIKKRLGKYNPSYEG